MLVGEGGSGRHSLTKLATFIAKYDLLHMSISKSFKLERVQIKNQIKKYVIVCI
jgi:dynein heavy chain